MKNFVSLIKYLKPYKKWALLAPFLIVFEVIMDLCMPNIMANIINVGIGSNDVSYIVYNIILMVILTVLGMFGGLGSAYFAAKASGYASADMRKNVFAKVMNLSFLNLDKIKTGHIITVLTNDITLIGEVMMYILRLLFRIPIILIGSIFMAIMISPRLSLVLVVIIPITVIVVSFILRKAFPKFQELQQRVDDVNTLVRENVGGIRVVKSFTNEGYEIAKFQKSNELLRRTSVTATRIICITMPVMMLFINMAIVAVLWFGGIEVIGGDMLIGDVIAFIQYLTNILSALLMGSVIIVMLSHSEASALRVNDICTYDDDFSDSLGHKKDILGHIVFDNVDFSYGGTDVCVLKNLNFSILPGEMIGIVGATGSGKTTLVNLINRCYDVTKGKILIDGVNVKDYNLKFLRQNIGIALQQPILFSGTIRDNLKYANGKISDTLMKKVAKIVQIDKFIIKSASKYDLKVEQKGLNFSGGQKQRISLGRTLLANPRILILDDTTSAVDTNTDKKIRDGLKKFYSDVTILLISSRVCSVIEADRIMVIDEGKIVDFDTHDNLLASCTIYQGIYNSQVKDGDINAR
ncbi:MAG: ABC transporter ATP-binding protein [Bacilli bacterium]